MSNDAIRNFCSDIYSTVYKNSKQKYIDEFIKTSKNNRISEDNQSKIETAAQKEAIKTATIEGMKRFAEVDAAMIWRSVYEVHVHRKSGVADADIISKVISADQSWKKSSGHAFEEMVKILGTAALEDSGIEIILQRDLNTIIKAKELDNEPRDISWLKEQIKAAIFDLYAIVHTEDGKQFCFGCIQSKTSIRDRVTRDREPSIQAMQSFFWSTILVLDGEYLKNPKFVSMVNGGTSEHPENGWHGMYVFSKQDYTDRIYPVDLEMATFRKHATNAAKYWLTQRQWFNSDWKADNND